MKVLYILASPTWGGGEEYVRRVVDARAGVDFVVSIGVENGNKMASVISRAQIFTFRPGGILDLRSAWRVARIVRREGVEVIHVNKFAHAFVAVSARVFLRGKVRVVMTRHLVKRGKGGWLYNGLYKRLDALIFVSDLARRRFLEGRGRVDEEKICVLHNALPDAPQRGEKPASEPVMAFVGRLVEEKGVGVLLDAVARLKELPWRLKIIGTGPQEGVLRAQVERLGLTERVVFEGFTDDVNAALQEVHIGVAPSVCAESFGLVLLEYMRAALAVVSTDNGAQTEFLDNGVDALLVPPRDVDALSEAVKELLENPTRRTEMGVTARRNFVARHTIDKMRVQLEKIYRCA